jgi:TolB-like protein
MKKTKTSFQALCIISIIFIASALFAMDKKPSDKRIEKKRIAVFDFAANNTAPEYAKIVRNFVETSLFATNDFRLIEREHIEKVLREKNIKVAPSADTSKAVILGRSLSADFIIVGSIDKLEKYRITLRVVEIEKGEILAAYTRDFSSRDEIDTISDKFAKRISADIRQYLKKGSLNRGFYDAHDLNLSLRFNYIYPLGSLGSMVNPGIGGSFEAGVGNIFMEDLSLGFGFGYINFTGKKNAKDTCTFVPIMISAGYAIHIFKRLYLQPGVSVGMNIVTLKHGQGKGFTMEENTAKVSVDPLIKAGMLIGLVPVETIHIQIGSRYGLNYEKDERFYFIEFEFGVMFVF